MRVEVVAKVAVLGTALKLMTISLGLHVTDGIQIHYYSRGHLLEHWSRKRQVRSLYHYFRTKKIFTKIVSS